MGEVKHGEWSGIEFLHQLAGDSIDASPVRATFLAHRVTASGRLWMTQGANIRSIDFSDGRIVGLNGYTGLLDAVHGERSWSLAEWRDAIVEADPSIEEPLDTLGVALVSELLRIEVSGGWMVNFVAAQSNNQAEISGTIDSFAALKAAIKAHVSDDDVRQWLESVAAQGVTCWVPSDGSAERWELDDPVQRLFSAAQRIDSAGSLFVEVGRDGWPHLAQLWRLGLIRRKANDANAEATADPPDVNTLEAPKESSPQPESASDDVTVGSESVAEPGPAVSSEKESSRASRTSKPRASTSRTRPSTEKGSENERRARRREDPSGRQRRKRKRDPRIVAITRAPYEHPEAMESQLKEAYDLLVRFRPEVIFRIKKSEDLDPAKIERRYLDACSRYHPDRYRGADQGVQSLAEGCFTAVSDAFHRLKDEQYVEGLRIRLIEKETGKRVVTDKTRTSAKVEYAKADVLFKQKRYDAAYELAKRAAEGDPDRWQYEFLRLRLALKMGEIQVDEVRQAVGSMPGMNSMEKGSALYIVGEMYMKEGDEKKAFELFRQTLSLDEQNVGARRRLRLKGRREQEANEREATGLFSGLFQRKKK